MEEIKKPIFEIEKEEIQKKEIQKEIKDSFEKNFIKIKFLFDKIEKGITFDFESNKNIFYRSCSKQNLFQKKSFEDGDSNVFQLQINFIQTFMFLESYLKMLEKLLIPYLEDFQKENNKIN